VGSRMLARICGHSASYAQLETDERAARARTERRAPRGRAVLTQVGRYLVACSDGRDDDRVS
jgi:hypothetical protein